MRNLHAIIVGTLEAWVWGYPYGRNGRLLGPGQGTQTTWWGNPINHAYLIQRGAPPPAREPRREWDPRVYWQPWSGMDMTDEQMLTPACGRIRTQSRNPRFELSSTPPRNPCPDCVRIVNGPIVSATQLRTSDPWYIMPRADRIDRVDPISGL